MPFIPLHDKRGDVISWARVSAEDHDHLTAWSWHLGSHGYATRCRQVDGRRYHVLLHRHLFGLDFGDALEIDHINRNRLDNRRCNLRVVTHAENMRNLPFQGVSYYRSRDSWEAYSSKKYGRIKLGYYPTRTEARAAVLAYHAECEAARAA